MSQLQACGKSCILISRHEAQICYCGEYNCVGTIGGKTQTDVGGMDDLFLDGESGMSSALTAALGILDEVNAGGMKGSRKKKARHLDEDYNVSADGYAELTTSPS